MRALRVALCIALVVPPFAHAFGASLDPETMVREITRRGVRVASVSPRSRPSTELAGHYSSRSEEKERRIGSDLTGEDLYLFPDGRYLYLEWGCLMSPTIHDKGHWVYEHGVMELRSDNSLPRSARPQDARYLPLTSIGRAKPLRLMGTRFDYRYFRKQAKPNDDLMLLICTKTRIESITPKTASALYKKLFESSWRPAFFSPRARQPNASEARSPGHVRQCSAPPSTGSSPLLR